MTSRASWSLLAPLLLAPLLAGCLAAPTAPLEPPGMEPTPPPSSAPCTAESPDQDVRAVHRASGSEELVVPAGCRATFAVALRVLTGTVRVAIEGPEGTVLLLERSGALAGPVNLATGTDQVDEGPVGPGSYVHAYEADAYAEYELKVRYLQG